MIHKEQIIGAVDIGTTKIVTIIGKINANQRLEILGLSCTESRGVKRGVVQNIEETVMSIKHTIKEAEAQSGYKLNEVFVGIAGQHIHSIKSSGYLLRDSYDSEITNEDLKRLENDMRKIPVEVGEEIIHVIPQNYTVDNEPDIKNPVGMFGKRIDANFHIVIASVTFANNIKRCIEKSGLHVKSLVLEPLASSEAVLTEDEKEVGVAMIDIGGGTSDLAVYYENIIRHTAVVPLGGNIISKDLKDGLCILPRHAEMLKIKHGSALQALAQPNDFVSVPGISGREPREISSATIAGIIQCRVEEILNFIALEIERSGFQDKLSAGIVVTGGGSMLKNVRQLINFRTGMDARIGFPTEHLVASSVADVNHPKYATAIGLVFKGYQYLREHKEGLSITNVGEEITAEFQPKAAPILETKQAVKEEVVNEPENKDISKSKFLNSLLNKFTVIFDETDTKM